MKPVLVPTDYTKYTFNAIHFAIKTSKVSKAKIILPNSNSEFFKIELVLY